MSNLPTSEEITSSDAATDSNRTNEQGWVLEGFEQSGGTTRTHALTFPCRVGRAKDADVTLPVASVSNSHAEIFVHSGDLYLRDLGSTNGTFLNRQPVEKAALLSDGDVIHFGEHETRLVRRSTDMLMSTARIDLSNSSLPNRLFVGVDKLVKMMRERKVEPHFQPVVDLRNEAVMGYEILGRGAYPGLPVAPYKLLTMAEQVGLEAELSVVFRDCGIEVGEQYAPGSTFYVNTHPTELQNAPALFRSLADMRERHPEASVVLEVHESAVLGSDELRALRKTLNELEIQLSYDDFGAGRSRLAELLEFPPEVVKFDMVIVRDLHLAAPSKLKMVGSLVSMLLQEGVVCLAEGVEAEEEAAACRELGFELAQGSLFGKPKPFRSRADSTTEVSVPPEG